MERAGQTTLRSEMQNATLASELIRKTQRESEQFAAQKIVFPSSEEFW